MSAKRRKVESVPVCGSHVHQVFQVTEAKHLTPKVFVQEAENLQSEILQLICDYGAYVYDDPLPFTSEEELQDKLHFRMNMHYTTSQALLTTKRMKPSRNRGILVNWLYDYTLHIPAWSEYEYISTNPEEDVDLKNLSYFTKHLQILAKMYGKKFNLNINHDGDTMTHFYDGTLPSNMHFAMVDAGRTTKYRCASVEDFTDQLNQKNLKWLEKLCGQRVLTRVNEFVANWRLLFCQSLVVEANNCSTCYVYYDFCHLKAKVESVMASMSVCLPILVPYNGIITVDSDYHVRLPETEIYLNHFRVDYTWLKQFCKAMKLKHGHNYEVKVTVPRKVLHSIEGNGEAVFAFLKMLPFE